MNKINEDNRKNLEEVKVFVQGRVETLFQKVDLYFKDLNIEDVTALHEEFFKEFFVAYIENVPKIKAFTEKMNKEKLIEKHTEKLMSNYKFHQKMAKCDVNRIEKVTKLTKEELNKNKEIVSEYIRETVQLIIAEAKELEIEDILELHIFVVNFIFHKDIHHIPCFEKAVKGMKLEVVDNIHNRKITEVFNKHLKMFK